jgi:hypothetical protein
MKKSGLADSPFFTRPEAAAKEATPPSQDLPAEKETPGGKKAIYHASDEPAGESPAKASERKSTPGKERSIDQSIDQSIDPSSDPSTDRPIDRSTRQSTEPGSKETESVDALGPVVDRPHAFYITAKVDRWLDEAVRYLKEKGLHKADRSVLVNALLHDPDLYQPAALDEIRAKLLAHLTNKSLKRVQSTG